MTSFNRCINHPKNETNLSCGKCGDPICFRCVVQTPVGIRCKKCAPSQRVPTFDVQTSVLAKALLVGIGMALFTGFIWSFLRFVGVSLIIIVGYLIGEVISLSVNRKRGRSLQYVAGASAILAFFVSMLFLPVTQIIGGLSSGVIGFDYALSVLFVSLRNVVTSLFSFPFGMFGLISIGIGVYLAAYKFR